MRTDEDQLLAPPFTLGELVEALGADTEVLIDRLPVPYLHTKAVTYRNRMQFMVVGPPADDRVRALYQLVLRSGGQLTHYMASWLQIWHDKNQEGKC